MFSDKSHYFYYQRPYHWYLLLAMVHCTLGQSVRNAVVCLRADVVDLACIHR